MLLNEALDRMKAVAEAAAERLREEGFNAKVETSYMNAFLATVPEPKKAKFATVSVVISTDDTEEGDEYCLSVAAEVKLGKVDEGLLGADLEEFDRMVNDTIERLRGYESKSEGISVLAAEANAEYEKLIENLQADQKKANVISAIGMGLFIIGIIALFIVATFSA